MTQETVLDELIRRRIPVTIYLQNGVGINGVLLRYDAFSFFLKLKDGRESLVYKGEVSNLKADQYLPLNWQGSDRPKSADSNGRKPKPNNRRRFGLYRRNNRSERDG